MNGYGSHTYQWINAAGERFWVQYHFLSRQGVEAMAPEEAEKLAGSDADYYRRDLFESIAKGDNPVWDVYVQIMPYEEAKTYRFNPFDITKTWSQEGLPAHQGRHFTLNRNPQNFFAEIEQAAFSPSQPGARHRHLARTRCSWPACSPTPTRSATASAPTTTSCRSTSRTPPRSAQLHARRQHAVPSTTMQPTPVYTPELARRARRPTPTRAGERRAGRRMAS